ncbi:MAG: alpha/beta fold hydrolase [Candidatus Thorarchaeota archaeon]
MKTKEFTEEILSKVSPLKAFALQNIANAPYYWCASTYDCLWIWDGVDFNASAISQLLNIVLENHDFSQNFEKLKMPIFLALGRYDYVSLYYLWDNLINNFSNLSYNLFEKSGHLPMLEEPELFDKINL